MLGYVDFEEIVKCWRGLREMIGWLSQKVQRIRDK